MLGQRHEGGALFPGTENPYQVAGFEAGVGPGSGEHQVVAHYRHYRGAGLGAHPEIPDRAPL
jgi:hypothetical protein